MANSDPLVPFGIAVIVLVGLFIAVPFFRGKKDLVTAWNLMLVGVIISLGIGSIEVKYVPNLFWEQLNWFQPTAEEVRWYIWANIAFIATLLAAYYLNTPAKRFAQRRFHTWPEVTTPVALFIFVCCFMILVVSIVLRQVTFIGPLTFNLACLASPAATVFSFYLWYRNRLYVGWLFLFLFIFGCACLHAMVVSGGRRLLVSVIFGPIVCMYWMHLRNVGRTKLIVTLGLAAFLVFSVSVVYSKFRYSSEGVGQRRNVKSITGHLQQLRANRDWFAVFFKGPLEYFGQGTGQFALLTQRYVAQRVLIPKPLNSIQFLVTYPIPRNIWPKKPTPLGITITRDAARIPTTNWGVGVAGHGIYEGGIPAIMLYAFLLAFGVRLFDEPLREQPHNPFLIYMLASAGPHILAIPRGDIGGMVMQAGQCVVATLLLGYTCRAIFGARRTSWTNNSVTNEVSF